MQNRKEDRIMETKITNNTYCVELKKNFKNDNDNCGTRLCKEDKIKM